MFSPSDQVLVAVFSCYVSIKTTTEGSWMIEVKENLIALPCLWSDDMYTETIVIFGNSHHGSTYQRSCSF